MTSPETDAPVPDESRRPTSPLEPASDVAPLGPETDELLAAALAEDLGDGDLTSAVAVSEHVSSRGTLIAKASGVVAGLDVFGRTFQLAHARSRCTRATEDSSLVAPGDVLYVVEGPTRALLAAERTALNLVARLSGIATLTRRFVDEVDGLARILDTRKTTPLHRHLEKYAVRCGGGENHRLGLFDEVMIKENHVAAAAAAGADLTELLARMRLKYPGGRIICEARTEAEALTAVEGDVDVVLLDNLSPRELRALVPRLRRAAAGRARPLEIEASGGVTLENVGVIASTGVDRISVGALTHSAPALDLSFALVGS